MYKSVIAGYSRSPFTTAKKGELIDVKPVNLLAEVINNLVTKSNIKYPKLDEFDCFKLRINDGEVLHHDKYNFLGSAVFEESKIFRSITIINEPTYFELMEERKDD